MTSEWKQLSKTGMFDVYRDGWIGVWDSFISTITKKPRIKVIRPFTFSIWVKSDDPVEIVITNGQFEIGKAQEK